MPYTIPTTEPDELRIGDSWKWKRTLDDYPASDGWTLSYSFRSAGKPVIDVSASADGSDHAISVAATATAAFKPGRYRWIARVSKSGDVHTIDQGTVEIRPNLATAGPDYDPRTHVEKVVDAIEATLEGTASGDESQMIVDGIQIGIASRDELLRMRDKYRAELAREKAAEKVCRLGGNPNKIYVRFTR